MYFVWSHWPYAEAFNVPNLHKIPRKCLTNGQYFLYCSLIIFWPPKNHTSCVHNVLDWLAYLWELLDNTSDEAFKTPFT